jgi:hypothetical protein
VLDGGQVAQRQAAGEGVHGGLQRIVRPMGGVLAALRQQELDLAAADDGAVHLLGAFERYQPVAVLGTQAAGPALAQEGMATGIEVIITDACRAAGREGVGAEFLHLAQPIEGDLRADDIAGLSLSIHGASSRGRGIGKSGPNDRSGAFLL